MTPLISPETTPVLPVSAPRLVVWIELPPLTTSDSADLPPRDVWYDPAALAEEPERWDGLA